MHHAPEGVVFIASQVSHTVVAELLNQYHAEFRHHTILLANPESLQESYQQALTALRVALRWDAQVITADITGGTKPMVAGATLALSGRGVTFSYVGGTTRDEHGRVRSGHENIRLLEDPSVRFHLREWSAFQQAWNACRFADARLQLEHILARPLSYSETHFFQHLQGIVQALEHWDAFGHREAHELLTAHLDPALLIAEAWRHGSKVRVLKQLQQERQRLRHLLESAGLPSRWLLEDLLANAERRAAAQRYDDALARLYRAVELTAEVDIYVRHGLRLKQPEDFASLSESLQQQARGVLGLKETLDLAFNVDLFFGKQGTLAQQLAGEYPGVLKPLLQKRHQSILAHGLVPVAADTYQALKDYLQERGLLPAAPWVKW